MLESFTSEKLDYQKLSLEEQKARGILGRLVGTIADTKNPTRNDRLYDGNLWEHVFEDPIVVEKIDNRCFFGELGHPEERELVDPEKIAICLSERPKKDKNGKLVGVFDILDTPNGRILKTLCDYGCKIGVSSRGTGDVYDDGDGSYVDPDTYNCECWDAVIVPAVKEARLEYVKEALDTKKYRKTLKEALQDKVGRAKEEERKPMLEALEELKIDLQEEIKLVGSEEEEEIPEMIEEPAEEVEETVEDTTEEEPMSEEDKMEAALNDILEILGSVLDEETDSINTSEILDAAKQLGEEGDFTELNVAYAALENPDKYKVYEDGEHSYIIALSDADDSKFEGRKQVFDLDGLEESLNRPLKEELKPSHLEEAADLGGAIDNNLEAAEDKILSAAGVDLSEIDEMVDILFGEETEENNEKEEETDNEKVEENIAKLSESEKDEKECNTDEQCADKVKRADLEEVVNDKSDDSEDLLISELNEALLNNKQLEEKVLQLQEELSVCNAKVAQNEVELANNIAVNSRLRESAKQAKEELKRLQPIIESHDRLQANSNHVFKLRESLKNKNSEIANLQKSLQEKDARIARLSSDKKDLIEHYDERLSQRDAEIKSLNESIDSLKNQLNATDGMSSEITSLKEQLEKSNNEKIRYAKLAGKYKSDSAKAKECYLNAMSQSYGLSADDVRSNLNESYSLEDVSSVCDELRDRKSRLNKLPIMVNESLGSVGIKSNRPVNNRYNLEDPDEVDDSLLRLANLK